MPEPTDPTPTTTVAADAPHTGVGTSVWLTAQQNSRSQRSGRYLPGSVAHPAKMLPAIARHAITTYTQPGDLVIDPMCGIGTTLVEALHLGRRGFGVEYEQRWAAFARANIELARSQGFSGYAEVVNADARTLPDVAPPELLGTAALVITSPPYGASLHGQIRSTKETGERGVKKFDYKYSTDKANLAHLGLDDLIDGFAKILSGCAALLRPGGVIAITARPWREHGELVDLPSEVITAGQRAGLVPVERCVALIAGIRDDDQVARPSFFQLNNVRKKRAEGLPHAVIVHEDLIVLKRPENDTRPAEARPEPARPGRRSHPAARHRAQAADPSAGVRS
jgi:modification methylase